MTRIAYLEISPRQTGKTTRLVKMARELIASGKQVVFVTLRGNVRWISNELPLAIVLDGRMPVSNDLVGVVLPDAVWFYDEFDYLTVVALREGAYYATTAARLRVLGDEQEDDILLQLLKANGNRHERYLWWFDAVDYVRLNREHMSAEQFSLGMRGEFLA